VRPVLGAYRRRMARLERLGDDIHVRLSRWEHLGALHRDLSAPLSAVRSIDEQDDLWKLIRGMRAPGTAWPGAIMLGTTRYRGGKDFCAVYRHRPGVVVTLEGQEFARWLLTDATAADIA